MDLGLGNKVAFITGSGRGIGLSTARALLCEGAKVIINSRSKDSLWKKTEELNKTFPGKCDCAEGDILDTNDSARISEYIENKYGKLDIFVANLGSGKPLDKNQLSLDEWQRFFDINVLGNVGMASKLHSLLNKGTNPAVVFVSSIVAKEAAAAPCGYAAAKSAVITLSKYLSKAWAADGIRVNCILPGNIYFEGGRWEELKNQDPDGVAEYITMNVPMQRFGKPEEIADMIAFLVSERASFVTGTEIAVDGGQLSSI